MFSSSIASRVRERFVPGGHDGVSKLKIFRLVLSAAALAALVACSTGPSEFPVVDKDMGKVVGDPFYKVGPGDRLNVKVYEAAELSVDVTVKPDGRISTPLVQDVMAAGSTSSELERVLAERLRKWLRVEPHVSVIVEGFVGPFDQQVKVVGAATAPAAVPYANHMSVLDLMIQVKGLTRFAAGNSAVIIRKMPAGMVRIPVRLADLLDDGDVRQNVELRPSDLLVIPQSIF